jgi:hypothetical protein
VRFLAHFWHANIPSGNPGWKWPDFHFCEMEESFCNCNLTYLRILSRSCVGAGQGDQIGWMYWAIVSRWAVFIKQHTFLCHRGNSYLLNKESVGLHFGRFFANWSGHPGVDGYGFRHFSLLIHHLTEILGRKTYLYI